MTFHDTVRSQDMMKQHKSSGDEVGRMRALKGHYHLVDITRLSPKPPCLSQNKKGFLRTPLSLTSFHTGFEAWCVQAASLCHAHATWHDVACTASCTFSVVHNSFQVALMAGELAVASFKPSPTSSSTAARISAFCAGVVL